MTSEELATKLVEVDQRSKSNTHRLEKVEERQDNLDKLVSTVASMATEQENIKDDVTEIKADVKSLSGRSSQRWDDLVDKVIWEVIGALIVFALTKIGIVLFKNSSLHQGGTFKLLPGALKGEMLWKQ